MAPVMYYYDTPSYSVVLNAKAASSNDSNGGADTFVPSPATMLNLYCQTLA